MSKGWISLHRQLQSHWLWEDKPFSRGQAWMDILLLVNHEEKKFPLGNEIIEVERGEHITSEYILAERWGWSRKKVRSFLELLVKDGMIEDKKEDKKRTRLKVCNYNNYQCSENYKRTTEELDGNYSGTSQELVRNLNNNVNNVNNSFLSSIHLKADYPQYPQYWDWLKKNNLKDSSINNLKWLHENASHYKSILGDKHPETINAIRMYYEKKAITQQII